MNHRPLLADPALVLLAGDTVGLRPQRYRVFAGD